VILRHATDDDAEALNSFDVGDTSIPWLAEVAEIVAGLLGWRSDPAATDEDRQVVIAERDGELVAVAAHVRLVGADGRSMPAHRYLMVTAVRADQQRTGLAQRLVESVLVDLRSQSVASVEWLVHPGNAASIAFSRAVFPEADETNPPDDAPYVSFALSL
jgi:N-acetylglutamate synthase-like GNAT family acetyltransferase